MNDERFPPSGSTELSVLGGDDPLPIEEEQADDLPDLAALVEEQQIRLLEQDEQIARLRGVMITLEDQASLAVRKYRDSLLALHADLPHELVQGESLAAVDASVAAARQVVSTIRQRLQEQSAAARVPAGAPIRGGPDLSDLSPQQKILLGLRQRTAG